MGLNENIDENDEPKVSMTLDDGTELECDVIAIFPVGSQDYIALLPDKVIDGYEEGEVFLYRFKELENDDIELTQIETVEEYEAVADAFDELLDEEEFNELDSSEEQFYICLLHMICYQVQEADIELFKHGIISLNSSTLIEPEEVIVCA